MARDGDTARFVQATDGRGGCMTITDTQLRIRLMLLKRRPEIGELDPAEYRLLVAGVRACRGTEKPEALDAC